MSINHSKSIRDRPTWRPARIGVLLSIALAVVGLVPPPARADAAAPAVPAPLIELGPAARDAVAAGSAVSTTLPSPADPGAHRTAAGIATAPQADDAPKLLDRIVGWWRTTLASMRDAWYGVRALFSRLED